MGGLFRVAIRYLNESGYIEYDPDTCNVMVVLDNAVKRAEVEVFLSKKHVIRMAEKTLLDFRQSTVFPRESVEMMKESLTQLWANTEVYVDWSRPIGVQ